MQAFWSPYNVYARVQSGARLHIPVYIPDSTYARFLEPDVYSFSQPSTIGLQIPGLQIPPKHLYIYIYIYIYINLHRTEILTTESEITLSV